MKIKIFIDGQEGTTGLKINQRLNNRDDVEILQIDNEKRKDKNERKKLINESDITFLCLPDESAKESVSLCENPKTKIIDASTAHRTNSAWAYGFPELSPKHLEKIKSSKRVAVPGCYATGFVSLMYPLVSSGYVESHYPVHAYGLSGYSGGGKKRIAEYESGKNPDFNSPCIYALGHNHKHLPEMKMYSNLAYEPMFTPIIDNFFNGMLVCVSLQSRLLRRRVTLREIQSVMANYYKGKRFIKMVNDFDSDFPHIAANKLADTNELGIAVVGNDQQILLCAILDNLGKGASGAAVQCMNIMLGLDETTGLI